MDGIMNANAFQSSSVKTYVALVNEEFARHLLYSCEYPRQRIQRPYHVDELASEMARGWYVKGTPLRFAALPNGDVWLLNGQHSLSAVVKTKIPQEFVFIFHRCANEEEANHIYSVIDINKPRTWGDTFKAYALDKEIDMNSTWMLTYAAACRLLQTSFSFDASRDHEMLRSRELQVKIYRDYAKWGRLFINTVGRTHANTRPFRRGGIMAVGMESLKFQQPQALEFWRGAFEDDGLRASDPRKTLLTYLRNNGSASHQTRKLLTSAAALCWSAWFQGEKMSNVYPSTNGRIYIDGTPWTQNEQHNPFKRFFAIPKDRQTLPAEYDQIETGVLYESSGARVPITQFIGKWDEVSDSPLVKA